MAFTVEKILNDAHNLSVRLKEHDLTADSLISRMQSLQRQVEAMKQYQENLNELNEIARHRPRASLIISLAQENSHIRELQQENKELRESLEEHQTALELIMSKYREQISKLLKADRLEHAYIERKLDRSEEIQDKMDKIYEMAAVMWKAIKIDDHSVDQDLQVIAQLEKENASMRELLQISESFSSTSSKLVEEKNTQTEDDFLDYLNHQLEEYENSELSSLEMGQSLSSSVIMRCLDDSTGSNASGPVHRDLPAAKTSEEAASEAAEMTEVSAALQQLDDIIDDMDDEHSVQ